MQVRKCYNRKPYGDRYQAQDGYWDNGQVRMPRLAWIENRMSKDCHQDKTDQCAGCKWEKTNED